MPHGIEYKPSHASKDIPTFCVIKPAANEARSDWHGFYLSIATHLARHIFSYTFRMT